MAFEPSIWSKAHGAATHFPIALVFVSAFCDLISLVVADPDTQRSFRFAATVCIVIGALVGGAAAFTGLMVSRWQLWGHGSLLMHHRFVWPAFVLTWILAVWRIAARDKLTSRPRTLYLLLALLAVLLMASAGYWGGETLNEG